MPKPSTRLLPGEPLPLLLDGEARKPSKAPARPRRALVELVPPAAAPLVGRFQRCRPTSCEAATTRRGRSRTGSRDGRFDPQQTRSWNRRAATAPFWGPGCRVCSHWAPRPATCPCWSKALAEAAAYVAAGEARGVHTGYKCSIRRPWFHVPSLWNPDAFLFRQIHDFPRFVRNGAGATATDTIHRVTAHGCDPAALVSSTFSHLTAASAEIEGRSYGGGVLELEPTEAERLLVPDALDAAVPLAEADAMVRAGRLAALLQENDRRLLVESLGFSTSDCDRLKAVWAKLRDRRFARGKRRKDPA